MRSKKGQVSIMAVCLVLGIMLAVQFKNYPELQILIFVGTGLMRFT